MTHQLKRPYISVAHGQQRLYGGSQSLSENQNFQRCGCGVVAALDLLLYLHRSRPDCPSEELESLAAQDPIPVRDYDRFALSLSRRLLPLIPGRGINGLGLALGLELFFLKHRWPFAARWGVVTPRFWESLAAMLEHDLPVILSVGPNFPLVWQKHRLNFYTLTPDGRYLPAASTCAHYVTVTGLDETWMEISSWGRKYYVNREEYFRFTEAHSNHLFSNILVLKET